MEKTSYGSVPHGGELINRFVEGEEGAGLAHEAGALPVWQLNPRELSDVEMILTGGYSPLEGFMNKADYEAVVSGMRLANGLPWTIPITLSLREGEAALAGERIALAYDGRRFAVLEVEGVFDRDKVREARNVFGNEEEAHPGVAALYGESDTVVAGQV